MGKNNQKLSNGILLISHKVENSHTISFSVNNSDFIESLRHFFKSLVDFKKEISINYYVLCDFVLYPSIISEPLKRKI